MEEKTLEKKGIINTPNGFILVTDEVVANIAGLAAMEVEGVTAMSSGIGIGILELLKKKDFSKGVKVELAENEAVIDVNAAVNYKYVIPKVATEVQEKVKSAVETKTGLTVKEVNIIVAVVTIDKEENVSEEPPPKEKQCD